MAYGRFGAARTASGDAEPVPLGGDGARGGACVSRRRGDAGGCGEGAVYVRTTDVDRNRIIVAYESEDNNPFQPAEPLGIEKSSTVNYLSE